MYEFSSKSQQHGEHFLEVASCWRYCKCTSFQANHNQVPKPLPLGCVVGDTANVRVFKQITTKRLRKRISKCCWRYCKCTSFQANHNRVRTSLARGNVVGDTANVRVFKQITTEFATNLVEMCCWRYCKCTSFQANHNWSLLFMPLLFVVGDTANVRVFKQITTRKGERLLKIQLLAILQMYEFSSKSQL